MIGWESTYISKFFYRNRDRCVRTIFLCCYRYRLFNFSRFVSCRFYITLKSFYGCVHWCFEHSIFPIAVCPYKSRISGTYWITNNLRIICYIICCHICCGFIKSCINSVAYEISENTLFRVRHPIRICCSANFRRAILNDDVFVAFAEIHYILFSIT